MRRCHLVVHTGLHMQYFFQQIENWSKNVRVSDLPYQHQQTYKAKPLPQALQNAYGAVKYWKKKIQLSFGKINIYSKQECKKSNSNISEEWKGLYL